MFNFRPNTIDNYVYWSVVTQNEYNIPDFLNEADIVIDVGAHIGSFTKLALDRGAGKVFAFEVDQNNYQAAKSNLEDYIEEGKAILNHSAVWGSGRGDNQFYFSGYEMFGADFSNTGGGRVTRECTGQKVNATSLDAVIKHHLSDRVKKVKLLKLDCEGSEWPILLTSKKLNQIELIVGELHELPANSFSEFRVPGVVEYTANELEKYLDSQGFDFSFSYTQKNQYCPFSRLGLFRAINRCYDTNESKN